MTDVRVCCAGALQVQNTTVIQQAPLAVVSVAAAHCFYVAPRDSYNNTCLAADVDCAALGVHVTEVSHATATRTTTPASSPTSTAPRSACT